jgi:hypothetical protein
VNSENEIWDSISLLEVTKIFSLAPFRWWIAGCHALELHLGRSWREHHDIDISFPRIDYAATWQLLIGWHISIASRGTLSLWLGEPLKAELNENNLWCKETSDGPWRIDLTVSDGNDHEWIFRRDQSLHLPWDVAVLKSPQGIPYLAPELQLLFKSKNPRGKDDQDAAEVIPQLDTDRQNFLKNILPENHPWRHLLV